MAKKRGNGEGSVYWSASLKRYVATVTTGLDAAGKPRRRSFYGPRGDKTNAAKLGVQARMTPYLGRRANGDLELLGPFMDEWIRHAQIRENTRQNYAFAAKHVNADPIARRPIAELDPNDVRRFYARLVAGDATKEKVHILLHRVMEEAAELELVARNPVSRVTKPRVMRRKMRVWTPEQALTFLSLDFVQDSRYYALFLLALTSTMGPAELFALEPSDLHLEGGYLVVNSNLEEVGGVVAVSETKTKSRRRRIDLPTTTVEALRRHLDRYPGRFVFSSVTGGPLRRNNFRNRVWAPLLVKAEEARQIPPIRFYDLRHTANALMAFLGVQIEAAKERMGHSSIRTTSDVYGHLYESLQRDVANRIDAFVRDIDRIATV